MAERMPTATAIRDALMQGRCWGGSPALAPWRLYPKQSEGVSGRAKRRGRAAQYDKTTRGERRRSPRRPVKVGITIFVLDIVIEIELVRRRPHADRVELLVALELEPLVERVLREHVATEEVLVVLLQGLERLFQAPRHVRDFFELLGRERVDVLVERVARVCLALDTVEPRHEHGREREVRIAARIRETHFDSARLGVRAGNRNAHAGRTVPARIREIDGGFEARNEAPVRVRRGVGESRDRLGVLDDAADVIERQVRKSRIAVASEEGLAVFPDRLVRVHTAAVVAKHGLRHERRGLAVLAHDVLHDVLEPHELVGARRERVELHADLTLPARRHLVVAHFDNDPRLLQGRHDGLSEIAQRVGRWNWKVAFLVTDFVSEVRELLAAAVPRTLGAVDVVVAGVRLRLVEAHVVEDEELGLWAHERRIANATLLEIGLGLLRDVTRISRIGLLRNGVEDRAHEANGRHRIERVDLRRFRVRDHDHVGRVDRLPTANRRAVERQAVFEQGRVEAVSRDLRMLPYAREIDELQIDVFDVVLLRELDNFLGCHFSSGDFPLRDRRRLTPAARSNSFFASFARTNAYGFIDLNDEYLSVPDATGLCALLNGVEHVVNDLVGHYHFDFDFWHEVDDVGRPSINFLLASGSTEAFDLGNSHSLHANLGEGVLHLVELERLDDRFNFLHASLSLRADRPSSRASPQACRQPLFGGLPPPTFRVCFPNLVFSPAKLQRVALRDGRASRGHRVPIVPVKKPDC